MNILTIITADTLHNQYLHSCHPFMPVIATCSGQRHIKSVRYADSSSDSDDSSDCGDSDGDRHTGSMRQENSVKLWYCGTT